MLIRSVRSAICTSGEPVSDSWRRYSLIVAEVSGIVRFVLFRHWPSVGWAVGVGGRCTARQNRSRGCGDRRAYHSPREQRARMPSGEAEMPGRSFRRGGLVLLVGVVGASFPGAGPPSARAAAAGPTVARAQLVGVDGQPAGTVPLTTVGDHLRVEVAATGLSPGFHGLHIHAKGVCDRGTMPPYFTSTGGHLGSDATPHAGHAGDLPSLFARADGVARARYLTQRVTLAEILDADGSAVVVHAGRDNFANIPGRYQSPDSPLPGPDGTTFMGG